MSAPNEFAITFADIIAAHDRIRAAAHRTPVLTSSTADRRTGASLFFKCENLQRAGAFKFRGACNTLARLTADQRAAGVVAFSSGNHAQAVALAARLLGMHASILMPDDAPASKTAATLGYGAEVIRFDRFADDREALAERLVRERAATQALPPTLLPPYDHPDVMAGQGTVARELIEDAGPLDLLVVPLGGGGLLSGCAIAAHALSPGCRVIGVEPATGNDGQQSLRAGRIVRIDTPVTIADGAQTRQLGRLTFPVLQRLVDEVVTVTDDELAHTMRFLASRMKLVVEPTGCLAAAAVLSGRLAVAGRRTGVVLSGGNIDLASFAGLLRPVGPP